MGYIVKVGGRVVSKHNTKPVAKQHAKKYRANIASQKKRGLTKGKGGRSDYKQKLSLKIGDVMGKVIRRPRKVGKLGKADVYKDRRGHKFIYVHKYGQKRRGRDYTKV